MTTHYQAPVQLHMAVWAVAVDQALILGTSSTCTQIKLAICMLAGRLQAAESRGISTTFSCHMKPCISWNKAGVCPACTKS